jgi:hypothetical protein
MPFEKGKGKTGGRQRGSSNRTTKLVKEVFATVFDELQDDPAANLKEWAKENPTEFYRLSAKLIPVQIAGDPENPLNVNLTTEEIKKKAEAILKRHAK